MSQLTDGERAVLDRLAEAWNLFVKLPVQHPMHGQEFAHAIHAAQRLVMSRPVARSEGWAEEKHALSKMTLTNMETGEQTVHYSYPKIRPSAPPPQPLMPTSDED